MPLLRFERIVLLKTTQIATYRHIVHFRKMAMHQLQYLTQSNFAAVVAACKTYESQYVTLASGEVVAAPTRTEGGSMGAAQNLRQLLGTLSDAAFAELLALAWTGRAVVSNSGWDFSANLEQAVSDINRDSSGRDYLVTKAYSLRDYLEIGLAHSGATFLRTF